MFFLRWQRRDEYDGVNGPLAAQMEKIGDLALTAVGSDGLPQLVIPLRNSFLFVSTSSGRLMRTGEDLAVFASGRFRPRWLGRLVHVRTNAPKQFQTWDTSKPRVNCTFSVARRRSLAAAGFLPSGSGLRRRRIPDFKPAFPITLGDSMQNRRGRSFPAAPGDHSGRVRFVGMMVGNL